MWSLFLSYLLGHLVGEAGQFRASASQLRIRGLCILIKQQTGTVAALPFADPAEHPGHLGLEGQLATVFQMRASSETLPCMPETEQRAAQVWAPSSAHSVCL